MPILFLLACAGPETHLVDPVPETVVEPDPGPTPYVVDEESSDVEPVKPQVLAVGIAQAIDALLHCSASAET